MLVDEEIGAALSATGLGLGDGGFRVEPFTTLDHSYVARIWLATPEGKQTSVIFKRSDSSSGGELGRREARFYRSFSHRLPASLTPRCLHSEESAETATLVLQDLPSGPQTDVSAPTLEQASAFVTALAQLHATGAEIATLQEDWASDIGDDFSDTASGRLSMLDPLITWFLSENEKDLTAQELKVIDQIRSGSGTLVHFAESETTILHGDAHYGNAIYNRDQASLIDWGNACLGPGEFDLAHALALNLPREVRAEWETQLISTYRHQRTRAAAPQQDAEVIDRYRLGILYAVVVPITHWAGGVPASTWRPLLANAVSATIDHNAASLLTQP